MKRVFKLGPTFDDMKSCKLKHMRLQIASWLFFRVVSFKLLLACVISRWFLQAGICNMGTGMLNKGTRKSKVRNSVNCVIKRCFFFIIIISWRTIISAIAYHNVHQKGISRDSRDFYFVTCPKFLPKLNRSWQHKGENQGSRWSLFQGYPERQNRRKGQSLIQSRDARSVRHIPFVYYHSTSLKYSRKCKQC